MNDEIKKKMDYLDSCYPGMHHPIRQKLSELMEKCPKYRWYPYRSFCASTYNVIFGSRDDRVWFEVFVEWDKGRMVWFIQSLARGPEHKVKLELWDGGL